MTSSRMSVLVLAALAACGPSEANLPNDGGSVVSTDFEPAPADRDAIVATLQSVFDALGNGDAELLRRVLDPNVVMHFTETDAAGETTFGSSTVEGLATRIQSGGDPLIERMWDPVVSINGRLATIWTPYDFYVGTTFSHCGVDAATLVGMEGGWKIVSLSWTRLQPPACPLHPEGPPRS